jgi:exopolyphosphatase/guanosine-5'-triphosphate,3'-diphosphate pyrophosphatase
MKIASIDIGTNAIKSKVFNTSPTTIDFIEGIRSPIRLGAEVFSTGILSDNKLDELIKTLIKYQTNFLNNDIKMYEIVATSAFRDTSNSENARRYVENNINHPIRIISGLEEAKLIRFHPKAQLGSNKIFVDVGGGSTEIYIYKNGDHIIQSFQLGAVRSMLYKDDENEWLRLSDWLDKQDNIDTLIGLGGSIKSFLNIYKYKRITSALFVEKSNALAVLSQEEKISQFNLQPDRADVIDYALKIYLMIINKLDIKNIKSTKWGVSDSIAVKIFHELYSKKISIYKD